MVYVGFIWEFFGLRFDPYTKLARLTGHRDGEN